MFFIFKNFLLIISLTSLTFPAFARCAICYTNGMSGASIAIIVILSSFLILFFANKILRSFLEKK